MDIKISLHTIVVQKRVIHVEEEHGVIGHFFLPELRDFSQYGDTCVDNAKASGMMRTPLDRLGGKDRTAVRAPSGVRLAFVTIPTSSFAWPNDAPWVA